MAESFNQWIGTVRGKPVLTLLENIRIKLMKKFYDRYVQGCTWDTVITPKIRKKLDASKYNGRFCKVVPASEHEFNVFDCGKSYAVNLQLGIRSCPYHFWEISGLPCKHAAACITHKRADIELYYHHYYSKETFLMAYNEFIHPILDVTMAEFRSGVDPVEPSLLRRMPGRPKKNRRREPGEPAAGEKNARSKSTVRCNFCHRLGHNKRTCPRSTIGSNKKVINYLV